MSRCTGIATRKEGAVTNNHVVASVLQADGKIVIGGNFNSAGMVRIGRLNPDGSRDATFNVGGAGAEGSVSVLLAQPDGKILVGGYLTGYNGVGRRRIARINADGSLDATFNPGSGAGPLVGPYVIALALQPDGKVLIGGVFQDFNGTARNGIARLNPDGTLDTTFVPGTDTEPRTIRAIALQPDGKILIGGDFTKYEKTAGLDYVARLNSDGSRDTSFTTPLMNDNALRWVDSLLIQSDGKVIVGGTFTMPNLAGRNYLARFNADGSHDTTFTPAVGPTWGSIRELLIQPDGKLVIGGDSGVARFVSR